MRKMNRTIVLLPLLLVWGIDQITKWWAEGLQGVDFYGPVGFALHHNHGAMLGLFSTLPAVLRIVTLSTSGAFLVFVFVFIQYLIQQRSLMLRVGLSVLLGGILGNVTDRIVYGYVVDFILLGSRNTFSPAFNLADALQWVGYLFCAVAIVRESEHFWPESNERKQLWVNMRFQLRYTLTLMGIGFGFALIAGVYSYTFIRVTIIELVGPHAIPLNQYLIPFVISFLFVSITYGGILFLVGRTLSARMAGPIYAFEKWLDDLSSGRPRALKFREGDEFKHLEQLAERVAARLNPNLNPNLDQIEKIEPAQIKNGTDE
jgi:signal peptidase II